MPVRRSLAAIIALHFAASLALSAELKLNNLFGDGMVVQRDAPVRLWGTATPGTKIEATVAGKPAVSATVDGNGRFRVELPALSAPGPYEISLKAGDGATVSLHDVLAGDVWVCSGQSNMQWTLADSKDADKEVPAATLPTVRLYYVPRVASGAPIDETSARWTACTPQTAAPFSGVAYFFGRKLNRDLNVPIGLIHTSWGGTPAESWTPLKVLRTLTDLPAAQRLVARGDTESTPAAMNEFVARTNEWIRLNGYGDAGISEEAKHWADPAFDDAAWSSCLLPADFAKRGVTSGSTFWVRRAFDVPAELAGQPCKLELGAVDDFDQAFLNGEPVGSTGVDTPAWTSFPRSYSVRADRLRAGRNVVAVRVHDLDGRSGFVGNAYQLRVVFPAAPDGVPPSIPLAGEWKYAIERAGEATKTPPTTGPSTRPAVLLRADNPQFPGSLYNGMIAPLGDLSVKGTIWYQGESNATRAREYAPLLSTMIQTWRTQLKNPDMPFYIVGLANYAKQLTDPNGTTNWGPLRQAQRDVARTVPHVATTVTIDVGDPKDIHPRDKLTVGERLANAALAYTYGRADVPLSPTLKSATREGGKIALTFDHVGGGLIVRGEKLGSFSIAGADGKFAWADATLDGDRVIVSSPDVAEPAIVRYAWADDPTPTLFNKEGLPAEPFEERVK